MSNTMITTAGNTIRALFNLMVKNQKNMNDFTLEHNEEDGYAYLQNMALVFAREGETKALESMIEGRINVDLCSHKGDSLLMLSTYNGNIECSQMIINNGASLDKRNDRDQTPLGVVAFKGDIEMVKLLLDNGADVNAENGGGKTPLMFAAMFGHKKVVDYLISRGADVNSQTFMGVSVLGITRITGGIRKLF